MMMESSPLVRQFSKLDEVSYLCMEYCDVIERTTSFETEKIDLFEKLKIHLDVAYKSGLSKDKLHEKLLSILARVDMTTNELNKFTFWDAEKPYTRNLVATDGKNYTLLLLCWSPGKESKIHNHPCDGCYVKTVRGCIRECQYSGNEVDGLKLMKTRFYNEGQTSYINDEIGYHKIGNPFRDSGSVSLHLYTPPFQTCKVWIDDKEGGGFWEEAKMGLFSVMGHRSPHLEGKPGLHSRLMREICDHIKKDTIFIKGIEENKQSFDFQI